MKKLMFVAIFALSTLFVGCANAVSTTEFPETIAQSKAEKISFAECESWEEAKELTEQVIATRPEGALQYAPKGIYNLEQDENYKVYIFNGPNSFYECCMLDEEEDLILLYHNSGEQGVSFQSLIYKGGKFKGLTENYILFEEEDSSITAVSIEEKDNCEIGEYQFETVSWEDLPQAEKDSAVYPSGYYWTGSVQA